MEQNKNAFPNPDMDTANENNSVEQTLFDVPVKEKFRAMRDLYNEMLNVQRLKMADFCAQMEQAVKGHEDLYRQQLQSAYAEIKRLTAENRTLVETVNELSNEKSDLEKKVNDYQQQAEKRNFNVELRKQNDELIAEVEEMKANMNKKVRERVKEATDKTHEKINALIKKQLDEVMVSDGSHVWNKQRKFLLGIFWRMPEIGGPLDAAGDEMIENSRRAHQQAEQKEEEAKAKSQRDEERADRTVDALEKQAEKPASQIQMDVDTINANGETVIRDSNVEKYYENINIEEQKGKNNNGKI